MSSSVKEGALYLAAQHVHSCVVPSICTAATLINVLLQRSMAGLLNMEVVFVIVSTILFDTQTFLRNWRRGAAPKGEVHACHHTVTSARGRVTSADTWYYEMEATGFNGSEAVLGV
jgi:hypothetical protein